MKEYFILSLTHSPWGECAVFWGPKDSGYFSHLDKAGIYNQSEIDKRPSYYNNGKSTIAIPCDAVKRVEVALWRGIIDLAQKEVECE